MDRHFVNVIMLGFGFMFLFTSFQTMGNIEVSVNERAPQSYDRSDRTCALCGRCACTQCMHVCILNENRCRRTTNERFRSGGGLINMSTICRGLRSLGHSICGSWSWGVYQIEMQLFCAWRKNTTHSTYYMIYNIYMMGPPHASHVWCDNNKKTSVMITARSNRWFIRDTEGAHFSAANQSPYACCVLLRRCAANLFWAVWSRRFITINNKLFLQNIYERLRALSRKYYVYSLCEFAMRVGLNSLNEFGNNLYTIGNGTDCFECLSNVE